MPYGLSVRWHQAILTPGSPANHPRNHSTPRFFPSSYLPSVSIDTCRHKTCIEMSFQRRLFFAGLPVVLAAFLATRAFTSFLISAEGNGLSGAKRIVPFEHG
jgi:hypothetical protein